MPLESQSPASDIATPAQPEIPLEFNPLLQEFRQNPYPTWHQFREADPVHWSELFRFWVCTRYDGSVQITARVALEDIKIGGKTIRKNQQALLLLGAANHDPAHFSDSDQLDITRQENPHLTFGHGIHHCLGAPLAQVEAQVAITSMLHRMPNIQLSTEQLEWRDMLTLRGIKALPVTF